MGDHDHQLHLSLVLACRRWWLLAEFQSDGNCDSRRLESVLSAFLDGFTATQHERHFHRCPNESIIALLDHEAVKCREPLASFQVFLTWRFPEETRDVGGFAIWPPIAFRLLCHPDPFSEFEMFVFQITTEEHYGTDHPFQ